LFFRVLKLTPLLVLLNCSGVDVNMSVNGDTITNTQRDNQDDSKKEEVKEDEDIRPTNSANTSVEIDEPKDKIDSSTKDIDNSDEVQDYTIKESLPLYGFSLSMVDTVLRFNMKKITKDGIVDYYFSDGEYLLDSVNGDILIDWSLVNIDDIEYKSLDNSMSGLLDGQEIFEITILDKSTFKDNSLDEYGQDITLNGYTYSISTKYLTDYFILKERVDDSNIESLDDFISKNIDKPFIGDKYNGLKFGSDGEIVEIKSLKEIKGGDYDIESQNDREVLFINPKNSKSYEENLCYIVEDKKIWKSTCYKKDSTIKGDFYDGAIYKDVLEYLQDNFMGFKLSI